MSIMGRRAVAAGQPSRIPTIFLALSIMGACIFLITILAFDIDRIFWLWPVAICIVGASIVFLHRIDREDVVSASIQMYESKRPETWYLDYSRNMMIGSIIATIMFMAAHYLFPTIDFDWLPGVMIVLSWLGFIGFSTSIIYIYKKNHPEVV